MKKRLPGTVWQAIQPLIDQYRHLIVPVVVQEAALHLKDADPESTFYFQCKRVTGVSGVDYDVVHVPGSTNSNDINRGQIAQADVVKWLKQWLEALDLYDKLVTVYDDPLLKGYQQEFASYFVLAEEDENESMPFAGQRAIKGYLDWMQEKLEDQPTPESQTRADLLESLKADVATLQEELPLLSKNQTVRRLTTIWAKARKFSISLVTELLTEFKKEVLKSLAKGFLELGSGTAADFWNAL